MKAMKVMSKGLYAILMVISQKVLIDIGKLGSTTFHQGIYLYIGRGSGKSSSIQNRVKRHISIIKNKFWHIDYLTSNPKVDVKAAIAAATGEITECQLAQILLHDLKAEQTIRGFGSSDCKCTGHLLYVPLHEKQVDLKEIVDSITKTFEKIGLTPYLLYSEKDKKTVRSQGSDLLFERNKMSNNQISELLFFAKTCAVRGANKGFPRLLGVC
jgi:Uri superfamily endonuclease